LPRCLPKQWTLYRCCWEQCQSWGQLSSTLSGCQGACKNRSRIDMKKRRG
jgi:hypothetical protein